VAYAYLGTSAQVSSTATDDGESVTLDSYSAIDAIGNRISTGLSSGAYLLADLHGNVAAAVSPGADPTYLAAFRYDAFGQTVDAYDGGSAPAIPYRFQGRILQSAEGSTDLYDFGARSYDPSLGTFISFDTVTGSAQNPLTLNRYLYALGNPATMIDPDGHWGFDPFTAVAAVMAAPVAIASAPVVVVGGVLKTAEAAVGYVQPGFQATVVEPAGNEVKTVWSAVSSPFAAIQGAANGAVDGLVDIVTQTVGGIGSLVETAGGCLSGQPCSVPDPPKIDIPAAVASGQNTVANVWGNFTDKVNAGDWHGAGEDAGHATVAIAQLAALAGAARAGLRELIARLAGGKGVPPPVPAPDFVATANGEVVTIPRGATGPYPTDTGKGFQYVGGSGGPGLSPRVTDVRIMDPIVDPPYIYPNGYVNYMNKIGQTISRFLGRTVAPSDPEWHIPFTKPRQ